MSARPASPGATGSGSNDNGPDWPRRYPARLLPLLASISREIEERRRALIDLEFKLFFHDDGNVHRARGLLAEIAEHRRELRHVREEVHRLGGIVVETEPPTFRFPERVRSSPAP